MSMSEYRLDELCEILDSKRVPLSAMQRAKRQGPYPYYGAQSIIDYVDDYLLDGDFLLVAEDGANLVTRTQDIANLVKGKIWVNNHAHILGYNGKCPLQLLGYILNHSNISPYVTGCAQPKLNQDNLRRIIIKLPEKVDEVSSFLSSLDDKIAVNKKICENLEAQAQALFKHWFVDFAPFKDGKFVESELGMIPEGWKVGMLSDVLDLIKETTNQGERPELPYLPIDSIPMNSFLLNEVKDNSEAQSSLLLFKKDDILVGAMRVYFHRVVPAPFDGITRSTCFVLRPKCDEYFSFALCVANSNDAIRYAQKSSKGSTMPYAVWDGGLGSYCILIPPKTILKNFNILLKNDINLIQNMYFENNRLATLRDTLLPKLMSGQIKV